MRSMGERRTLQAVLTAAVGTVRAATPPLPVRKVVLYKHGMGYLERRGKVTGDATVSFSFRADQMKDLLTSFYAVDLGGGVITSVRYDTAEPLSRRLQEILIKVPESAALSQFLPQLKGARISAKVSGEAFVGRVLGLEPFTESTDGTVVRQGHLLVVMTDGGALRSADLATIGELTGYVAGFSGQAVIENRKWYDKVTTWMKKYGGITVLVLAFVPNPVFDIAGMVAGALRMPLWQYLLFSWIGKFGKMLLFAYGGAKILDLFS